MPKIPTICAILLLVSAAAFAQNNDIRSRNITWITTTDHDLITDSTYTSRNVFVSFDTTKIEMRISNFVQVFDIKEANGTWHDASQPGEVIYDVTLNGETGIIRIGRDGSGVFLELNMTSSGPEGIHRMFSVTSFDYND